MIKITRYFVQAVFIYIFYILIKIIGLKNSRIFFSKVFQIIGPLIKSKNIIDDNLYKVFGETKDAKKINIVASMWSNYGKTFVEYIYLNKFRDENLHVNITKGLNTLPKIKKNNKPVIFISGHFANFELMSMEITKKKNRSCDNL